MTNQDNHSESQWDLLLDRLEAERAKNPNTWTEAQERQLDELRALLKETGDALTLYTELDVEEGWINLRSLAAERQLLDEAPQPVGAGRTRRMWSRIVAAASVILALSVGGYFVHQQYATNVPQDSMPAASAIQPGGSRAQLVLPDGQLIVLREDQQGIAIGETGIAYLDGDPVSGANLDVASVTLEVPRAGQYQIQLPDGTNVWLNAASSLTYPMQFSGEARQVELTGEAYFEVAHDADHPFVVSTHTQEITVLGTHFNIQAYIDESHSRTTLIEGAVRVRLVNHTNELILAPGEQAVTDFQTIQMIPADLDQVLAWKNGKFVFHGQDLATIMRQISRWYDVDVQFDHDALRHLKFGGTVARNNNLATVLEAMENTGNISFDVRGKNLIVRNVH